MQTKNGLYIFKWLEKNQKESISWHTRHVKFSVRKFYCYWNTATPVHLNAAAAFAPQQHSWEVATKIDLTHRVSRTPCPLAHVNPPVIFPDFVLLPSLSIPWCVLVWGGLGSQDVGLSVLVPGTLRRLVRMGQLPCIQPAATVGCFRCC